MMASRSSQATSSKGLTPGFVKWREKVRPGAVLEDFAAGAFWALGAAVVVGNSAVVVVLAMG